MFNCVQLNDKPKQASENFRSKLKGLIVTYRQTLALEIRSSTLKMSNGYVKTFVLLGSDVFVVTPHYHTSIAPTAIELNSRFIL